MSELLWDLLLILYVSSTVGILWFMVSYLLQLRRHCRLGPVGWAAEQRLLATALPSDAELPHVVVQIVSYNEGELVRRALQAAARLDWPKDRLHIQLLDDSTDHTPCPCARRVADLAAGGLDIVILHRRPSTELQGGRAGRWHGGASPTNISRSSIPTTCRAGLPAAMHGGVARRSGSAFVQARIDYLNADENALTRA